MNTEQMWIKGVPEKHWAEEWFIAVLDNGDRVVLKALPEEYSYDFTTADATYFKSYRIKKWMQFPDSQYTAPQQADKVRELEALEKLAEQFEGGVFDRMNPYDNALHYCAKQVRNAITSMNTNGKE